MSVTVLEVKELMKMDTFGENDPYVIVGINAATHRTRTVTNGGEACEFEAKHNNKLKFRHVEKMDSVIVRVFDEDIGSASTDDQIGCTDDLGAALHKYDIGEALPSGGAQDSNGSWQHEEWFTIRQELHMMDMNVA